MYILGSGNIKDQFGQGLDLILVVKTNKVSGIIPFSVEVVITSNPFSFKITKQKIDIQRPIMVITYLCLHLGDMKLL